MSYGDVVSTVTVNWVNGGNTTLVGAYGAPDYLVREMSSGSISHASLQSREHLMAWGIYYDSVSKATMAGALWWSPKKATGSRYHDWSGE